MDAAPRRISVDDSHDLRDALAITKGWLEVLFRRWPDMPEQERFQCVAAALHGAHQMCFHLQLMDGIQIDLAEKPELKMAEEFWRLAEQQGS
ncbi:MAG: hypothetical protein M3N53_12670 [Actinomycetota bacterium]|nr:hypothetical protein [Actinomycetota bacterium]